MSRQRKSGSLNPGEKPWGGRFQERTHRLVETFMSSLPVDRRLYKYDILGSIAH